MTPAVKMAEEAGVDFRLHRYQHDPGAESYGLEAAQLLDLDPRRVFKTLLAVVDDQPQVAMVPVHLSLDLKALAKAAGGKKARMADADLAQRVTGYVLGGISPLGQKRRSPLWLDESALSFDTLYMSAGRRGVGNRDGGGGSVGADRGPVCCSGSLTRIVCRLATAFLSRRPAPGSGVPVQDTLQVHPCKLGRSGGPFWPSLAKDGPGRAPPNPALLGRFPLSFKAC